MMEYYQSNMEDKKVLVKDIYTIHEEDENERKSEVEIHDIQPNIEESDHPIPKKHLYLMEMLYKIFYQMICVNQSSFNSSSSFSLTHKVD